MTARASIYFDRFDVCEAYACLAHDYGLYALFDRLAHRMRFRPAPALTTERLNENARAIYDTLGTAALKASPYDPAPFRGWWRR